MRDAIWLRTLACSLWLWAGALCAQTTLPGSTTINAKSLSFDYKRYTAVFEGNVVVVDPQVKMEADRLNVIFEGSNEVKSVAASGHVRLWHEDKTATCDRAIYVSRSGEVILRGDATLRRGDDRVMGDEITFWLNEDRMTCTPGRLVIGPQDSKRPGGASGSAASSLGLLPNPQPKRQIQATGNNR
ncbi:MAG: hypothetical protein K8T26_07910 [Lentisphaerae bacterium]|nr:hypothetical protein [Lentisphaerota bacterium]